MRLVAVPGAITRAMLFLTLLYNILLYLKIQLRKLDDIIVLGLNKTRKTHNSTAYLSGVELYHIGWENKSVQLDLKDRPYLFMLNTVVI